MAPKAEKPISVIVPDNPFITDNLRDAKHCLAALDVERLMEWWPGKPHTPNRDPLKVSAIQRSLDWKRVAQIAAYLLQRELVDAPKLIDKYFKEIYGNRSGEPGRQWPPKLPRVIGYTKSSYPTFSNILVHVNGAKLDRLSKGQDAAKLSFENDHRKLNFMVIDGQHRINGAYLALQLRRETEPKLKWQIPAEVFIDLDKIGQPPKHQAQIFIDVNSNQKKVDRSLVADLYPTARDNKEPLGNLERAQDLGRKLMLETGPLVGMIQIPGIRYGVKDVVALATLNSAIELALPPMIKADVITLDEQVSFLSQCLDAWLTATGRKEEITSTTGLSPDNVAYQGRVLVSFLTLIPACIWKLKKARLQLTSEPAQNHLVAWFKSLIGHAGLSEKGLFLEKKRFKEMGYLGAGGLARFRDTLWVAAFSDKSVAKLDADAIARLALEHRGNVERELSK